MIVSKRGRIFFFGFAKQISLTDPTEPEFEVWLHDAKLCTFFIVGSWRTKLLNLFAPWRTKLDELYFQVKRNES